MHHYRQLFLVVCAALQIALCSALNVTIESASCQGLSYKVSGNLSEINDIPAQGEIVYGDLSQKFTLPSLVSPTISEEESSFEVNEEISYLQNVTVGSGPYTINLTLYTTEEMTERAANASYNASCLEASATEATSFNTTSTVEVYTTTVSTEGETTVAWPLSSSLIPSASVSSTEASASTSTASESIATELPTSVFDDSWNSAGESQEKNTHIKEGVSVGVLGFALALVVFLGCALIKRKRRQEAQRNRWQYSNAWDSSGNVEDVREASM